MKAVKILLLVLAVAFIAIQFMSSGIPDNKPDDERSFLNSGLAGDSIIARLKTSCFDCHSHQTDFPWYSRIAPVSWWLANHIRNGKEHLNFSEWEDYSTREKIGLLNSIADEVESGSMPLRSYLIIHRDAKLSPDDVSTLTKWVEEVTEKILE